MTKPQLDLAADSMGQCFFCKMVRQESGMAHHLQSCSARRRQFQPLSGSGSRSSCHMIATPCGSPRTWWHIEVAGDLTLGAFREQLTTLWAPAAHGVFAVSVSELLDTQTVANIFIPGLIARYDAVDACLMVQVISWYDGQSAPGQTMVTMAASLS